MKNQRFTNSNLKALVLTLGFAILLLASTNSSFARTTLNRKMVLYKGEWITRVDMPEVTIEANRIKNNKSILKNVETVYHRGEKTLHITLEEIVITGAGNNDISIEVIDNPENKSTNTYSIISTPLLASNSKSFDKIYLAGSYNALRKENLDNLTTSTKTDLEITRVKKPKFNRIVNNIFDAGFNFLKKVNDGLFFKS